MTGKNRRFIVVDDEPANNLICKWVITRKIPDSDVLTFTDPETALAYIISTFGLPNALKTIILLDINMPTMTGWKFMDRFEKLEKPIKESISIYILSSSIDPADKEKARTHRNVSGFIEKPLSAENVQSIMSMTTN